jgi:CRISPR/Cas system-associated exonuclease Cas4 (RecB family)
MRDIETKVGEVLRDSNRLKCRLMLEKERRGVSQDALVFVGTANVASHWWCTQQAVLKSRAIELVFFAAYLSDRILYAHRLGLVTKLPRSRKALLDVGSEITWEDVELLLKEEADEAENQAKRPAGAHATWLYEDRVEKDGKRKRLINPDLPPEEKQLWEELAAVEGVQVIDLEEDPKRRGEIYQASRAEKYPTIRWHFPWGRYSVGGVPDGLTEDFAYEYKTTRSRFLFSFMKPVALAQADLYAYFFHRPKKRVQIHVIDENVTETYEEAVDAARAEATLAAFARVDAGQPARPPRAWKCRKCDFRATCPISQG